MLSFALTLILELDARLNLGPDADDTYGPASSPYYT